MSTVREIITRAYRKIGIAAKDEALDADDIEYGLGELNALMASWKGRGVDVSHTTLVLTDTFPLDAEYEDVTVILLAEKIAPSYSVAQPPALHIKDAWDVIKAAYMTVPEATFDTALDEMPSERRWYY